MKTESGDDLLLRGTPIRDYNPNLSDEACAVIARIFDDISAGRARRRLEEKAARVDDARLGGDTG
jgi:hypothetical protein